MWICGEVETSEYTPALVCLLVRDRGDTGQCYWTVDGGREI